MDTAIISGAINSLESFFIEPHHLSESLSRSVRRDGIRSLVRMCYEKRIRGILESLFRTETEFTYSALLFTCSGIGSALSEVGFVLFDFGNYSIASLHLLSYSGGNRSWTGLCFIADVYCRNLSLLSMVG